MPISARPALPALVSAALAVGGLALTSPASAAPPPGVVISEAYGGGGNSGATLKQDFVELYNPGDAAVPLSGLSLQYRSGTSTSAPSGVFALTGSIPAKGHWLVAMAKGTGGTTDLPTPDQTGDIAMSGTAGTVLLASGTAPLPAFPTGSTVGRDRILDAVGYGSQTFEGTTAPGTSNAQSVSRSATGTDTDSNVADFTLGTPSPTASGGGSTPPGDPEPATIAQVQGTTDVSPYAGRSVVTDGVVTASYPTGGFRGFYLQTPGTGGDLPADHAASDAVFVFLGSATTYPRIGDHVRVTGPVSEFAGLTEISPAAGGVTTLTDPAAAVKPVTDTYPATAAGREALEGMLVQPGAFTVADVFTLNQFGEIKLGAGTEPLRQPTDVARPGSAEAQAVAADNAARSVTLDDGASINFLSTGKDTPLPWITHDHSVRVGAPASFTRPVVLDFRNNAWKFQPTSQLTADNAAEVAPATFPDTRPAAPAPVGGQLKIASFNVLNFFVQTGEKYVASGHSCTSFKDRAGTPVTVDDCGPTGPRGAWGEADLTRQRDKIVHAINTLGADVLSLEEIENSAKFVDAYTDPAQRDVGLASLVDALNAAAGSTVWAYVPSPAIDQQPPLEAQDVIRTAFIYKPAAVEPVGPSHILLGSAAFANARQPLAQVFRPRDGASAQRFLAVVNHFKSKGSGTGVDADQGDGQGASNHSRVLQAQALVDFVDGLKTSTGVDRVLLTGDFNAYTHEDPIQVLADAGYVDLGSRLAPTESTYVFDGLVGSLDHVLANDVSLPEVKGAHVWNINSVESVAYEYSRHNYNATDFYAPDPYRSSDHDPTLVGFTVPDPRATSVVRAVAAPPQVREGRTVHVVALVTSDRRPVSAGTVEVREGDRVLGTAEVRHGAVVVPVQVTGVGEHTLTVAYRGSEDAAPSTTTVRVVVRR